MQAAAAMARVMTNAIVALAFAAPTFTQCPPVSTYVGFHREGVGSALAAQGDEAFFGHFSGLSVGVFARLQNDWWTRTGLASPPGLRPSAMGAAVDIRGNTAVLGDPLEYSHASSFAAHGAIAIFERGASRWNFTTAFTPPTPQARMGFGTAVALSDDAAWTLAGAPWENQAGAVYVYRRQANGWTFDARLAPNGGAITNDRFGSAVAMAGGRAFVGASGRNGGQGAVFVFERRAGVWTQVVEIVPTGLVANDSYGQALEVEADRLVASAPGFDRGSLNDVGLVVEHRLMGSLWTESGRIPNPAPVQSALFGRSLDLSGARLAVGGTGHAFVFDRGAGGWSPTAHFTYPDAVTFSDFGRAVALYSRGLLVGAPRYDDNGFEYPDGMGAVHSYDLTDYGNPLTACGHTIGTQNGNSERLLMNAPAEANRIYLVVGSITGTGPQVIQGITIPLSLDGYFLFTIEQPGSIVLPGGVGVLDANGRARADFVLPDPFIPTLLGLRTHHAFVTFRADGTLAFASNAVLVSVVP